VNAGCGLNGKMGENGFGFFGTTTSYTHITSIKINRLFGLNRIRRAEISAKLTKPTHLVLFSDALKDIAGIGLDSLMYAR
jgi:hypothetical protein